MDLAYLYGKISKRLGLILSTSLGLSILLSRFAIMRLFSADPTIIQMGANTLIILAFIIQFQIAQVITVGSLRGAGDTKFVAKMQLISVTFLRPTLTFVLAYTFGFGLYGAWFSVMVDQWIRYFISRQRFNSAEWAKIEV